MRKLDTILIATDKFKDSLTAYESCKIIEQAVKSILPNITTFLLPLADGGEGTLDVLTKVHQGTLMNCTVKNPLFKEIEAQWGLSKDGKTAYIEMAQASGLQLVPKKERNPLYTTSYGTGQIVAAALNYGVEKIILGVGGSATNDGGMGLAAALGYEFYDSDGNYQLPIGKNMINVCTIKDDKIHPRLKTTPILAAIDVFNPLFGEEGAAFMFGKQKGANKSEIQLLDQGLKNLNKVVTNFIDKDLSHFPGSGAGGGLGYGLLALCNAKLVSGIDLVMQELNMESVMRNAQLVITGEGKIDMQTLQGKAVFGIAQKAQKLGIPVIAMCGICEAPIDVLQKIGIQMYTPLINDRSQIHYGKKNAKNLLYIKATQAIQAFLNT